MSLRQGRAAEEVQSGSTLDLSPELQQTAFVWAQMQRGGRPLLLTIIADVYIHSFCIQISSESLQNLQSLFVHQTFITKYIGKTSALYIKQLSTPKHLENVYHALSHLQCAFFDL